LSALDLIKQVRSGFHCECPRKNDALCLTRADLVRKPTTKLTQTPLVENSLEMPRVALDGAVSNVSNIFFDREVREWTRTVGQNDMLTDSKPQTLPIARPRDPTDLRPECTDDQPQERRLPAPVRTV
jgi:hypothetical protein